MAIILNRLVVWSSRLIVRVEVVSTTTLSCCWLAFQQLTVFFLQVEWTELIIAVSYHFDHPYHLYLKMNNEKNKISPETQGEQGIFQKNGLSVFTVTSTALSRGRPSTLVLLCSACSHLKKQTNTLKARKMVVTKQSLTVTLVEMFNWASFVQIVYCESFTGRIFAL